MRRGLLFFLLVVALLSLLGLWQRLRPIELANASGSVPPERSFNYQWDLPHTATISATIEERQGRRFTVLLLDAAQYVALDAALHQNPIDAEAVAALPTTLSAPSDQGRFVWQADLPPGRWVLWVESPAGEALDLSYRISKR